MTTNDQIVQVHALQMSEQMKQDIARIVHESFTTIATIKHGDIQKYVFDELEAMGSVAHGYVSALALKAVLEKLEYLWNEKIINQQG